MVFLGGGDQKRSLVGWLRGARLLGQQIKDEASGMSDWVLITHGQSLQRGETEPCLSTQLPNLPPQSLVITDHVDRAFSRSLETLHHVSAEKVEAFTYDKMCLAWDRALGWWVSRSMHYSGKKFSHERHCHHWWLMQLYTAHTPIAKNPSFDLCIGLRQAGLQRHGGYCLKGKLRILLIWVGIVLIRKVEATNLFSQSNDECIIIITPNLEY